MDTQILILGNPRSGTGYMSKLLQELGYDIGHETMGKNGTSNWLYAVNDVPPPSFTWIPGSRNNYKFDIIIHVIRDPSTCIPSIAYTETDFTKDQKKILQYESTQYRTKHTHINPSCTNHFEHAALSYIYWNKIIENLKPTIQISLENAVEDLKKYRNILPFDENKKIDLERYNVRNHPLGEEELKNLSPILKKELQNYCIKYGYNYELFE
jgi:hypothetical protein